MIKPEDIELGYYWVKSLLIDDINDSNDIVHVFSSNNLTKYVLFFGDDMAYKLNEIPEYEFLEKVQPLCINK
jgi:hypothetical protein